MAEAKIPQGQRFSHVYLHRPEQLEDSERMRYRLGALMQETNKESGKSVIFKELGIIPVRFFSVEDWMKFYKNIRRRGQI